MFLAGHGFFFSLVFWEESLSSISGFGQLLFWQLNRRSVAKNTAYISH
jgi:hypothetical protein